MSYDVVRRLHILRHIDTIGLEPNGDNLARLTGTFDAWMPKAYRLTGTVDSRQGRKT
jgi:hypothetical protein